MTVRPTTKHHAMKHSAAARVAQTSFAAPVAAVLLALLLCAFPLLSAYAVEEKCKPGNGNCTVKPVPVPSVTFSQNPSPAPAPTATTTPDPQPVIRKPAPAKPPVVTPAPAPTTRIASPDPTAKESESASPSPSETAPSASPSHTPWTASAAPSTDSNWTKPIDEGKEASQAALIGNKPGSGPDLLGILAIMAGVLVVGLGGVAFAMWSRNRIGSH